LTAFSSKCFHENFANANFYYYYEPIQINVVQSGNYTMSSVDSRFDGITGYLYKEHFDQFILDKRLIARNLNGCPRYEFKIITELQSSVTYILIVTSVITLSVNNFSLLISGPNNITLNPISKSNIESIISSFNRDFH